MARTLALRYQHSLHARDTAPGNADWRDRLAWLFRRWADRLDNGQSIRVEVDTQPWIGTHEAAKCIERGMELSGRLIGEAAKAKAVEELMHTHCAQLYEAADDR